MLRNRFLQKIMEEIYERMAGNDRPSPGSKHVDRSRTLSGGRRDHLFYTLFPVHDPHGSDLCRGDSEGEHTPGVLGLPHDGPWDGLYIRHLWLRRLGSRPRDAHGGRVVEHPFGHPDDPDGSADLGCDPHHPPHPSGRR